MRDVNFISTLNIKVNKSKRKNPSLVLNKTFGTNPRSLIQAGHRGSNRQLMETSVRFASQPPTEGDCGVLSKARRQSQRHAEKTMYPFISTTAGAASDPNTLFKSN